MLSMQMVAAGEYTALNEDSVHDKGNPALELLQEPQQALKDFPLDNAGSIDWVKTLNDGHIEPRKGVTGKEK